MSAHACTFTARPEFEAWCVPDPRATIASGRSTVRMHVACLLRGSGVSMMNLHVINEESGTKLFKLMIMITARTLNASRDSTTDSTRYRSGIL